MRRILTCVLLLLLFLVQDGCDGFSDNDPSHKAAPEADANIESETDSPSDDCDRGCLIGFVTEYLDALVRQDPSRLPVSEKVKFTENGDELELGEGLWQSASALKSYRQDFVDSKGENVGSFAVVEEDGSLTLLSLRLKIAEKEIVEIETVVTRTAEEATFFEPESLTVPDPIYDELLDESQGSSRERMIEIADIYFDGIVNNDGSVVPFHEQCGRIENGRQTATGDNIAEMFVIFTYITEIKRRYIIVDEDRGLVWGIFLFMVPPGETYPSRTIFIAELFKVVNEEIRSIEAFMVDQSYGKPSGW